jgi:hypothetical protein
MSRSHQFIPATLPEASPSPLELPAPLGPPGPSPLPAAAESSSLVRPLMIAGLTAEFIEREAVRVAVCVGESETEGGTEAVTEKLGVHVAVSLLEAVSLALSLSLEVEDAVSVTEVVSVEDAVSLGRGGSAPCDRLAEGLKEVLGVSVLVLVLDLEGVLLPVAVLESETVLVELCVGVKDADLEIETPTVVFAVRLAVILGVTEPLKLIEGVVLPVLVLLREKLILFVPVFVAVAVSVGDCEPVEEGL